MMIMLIHIQNPIISPALLSKGAIKTLKINNKCTCKASNHLARARRGCTSILTSFFAAGTVFASVASGTIVVEGEATQHRKQQQQQEAETTLSNIPQTLSSECASSSSAKDCKKPRIQRPKSRKAESCTLKCLTTCIRGGEGSPGEGPLNIRRPLVVFKQGFRSRQYCLVECSDICNLIGDGDDDGP